MNVVVCEIVISFLFLRKITKQLTEEEILFNHRIVASLLQYIFIEILLKYRLNLKTIAYEKIPSFDGNPREHSRQLQNYTENGWEANGKLLLSQS